MQPWKGSVDVAQSQIRHTLYNLRNMFDIHAFAIATR